MRPIKFGADLSSDSSDDDSAGAYSSDVLYTKSRPWLKQKSMSSSTPTLVDIPTAGQEHNLDFELAKLKKVRARAADSTGALEYSDYEEDVGLPSKNLSDRKLREVEWTPGFLKEHMLSSSTGGTGNGSSPSIAGRNGHGVHPTPMAAVPATPSLIKALDRISAAQKEAFGPGPSPTLIGHVHAPQVRAPDTLQISKSGGRSVGHVLDKNEDDDSDDEQDRIVRAPRWDDFWRDVRRQAQS